MVISHLQAMKYEEHRVFINRNQISHYFYYQLDFLHGHNLILPLKHLDNCQQSNPCLFNQLFLNTYSPSCFIFTSIINNLQLFFTISWLFYYPKISWLKSRVEFNHTTISCLFLNSHHPPASCSSLLLLAWSSWRLEEVGLPDQIRRSFFDFARSDLHFRCGVAVVPPARFPRSM